jgi:AcrR family transcriptional regulator
MAAAQSPHATAAPPLHGDRRRARSSSSSAKIVVAMLDLVGRGDVSPTAARVAEVAGVGLRSVFRHFRDMDALYSEMSQVIEARIMPIVLRAFAGTDWKDRLVELAERRAELFEAIMPYRISANLRRFESPYLMQDYRRMLRLERQALEAHLPDAVRADPAAAGGLNVILSFQTWRLLRNDQELTIDAAKSVVRRLLADALAAWPDT